MYIYMYIMGPYQVPAMCDASYSVKHLDSLAAWFKFPMEENSQVE